MKENKPLLSEGQIVLPYDRDHPMVLYKSNHENSVDAFVRAKFHEQLGLWWSETDFYAENGNPRLNAPGRDGNSGLIVFVDPNTILCGLGIRITRVFNGGTSAKGVAIRLPIELKLLSYHDQRILRSTVESEFEKIQNRSKQ
jgi:hypothetical protein